jgi:shikimate dehydrogenase
VRQVTASTPLYALLGNPANQSLSPVLQNGWIAEHGFDGVYVALAPALDQFETALEGLFQAGLQGANVTSPFKERAAAKSIDLSPRAHASQSVNCLTRTDLGFKGDSTDGAGLLADLDIRASGWREQQGHIVLLGAGGAARALLTAFYNEGFRHIDSVNRTLSRAKDMMAPLTGEQMRAFQWDDMDKSLAGASLVINATSAGLKGVNPFAPDLSMTRADALIYDTIYAPRQTAFLAGAVAQKRRALDGLGLLVGQGALAFENWFGTRPDLLAGLKRLEAALAA